MRRSFEAILCVFLAPLALLFLSTASRAEDLLVKNGESRPLSGDQTFDVVTVEAGGILVLNGQMKITCSRFSFAGKLIISGDTVIEATYGRDHPDSTEWAMRIAPNEVFNPFNPLITVDYPPRADDGDTGESGAAGSPGVDGYRLSITVHGHLVIESTEEKVTKFYIAINGQSGGSGVTVAGGRSGNAGQGGKGGILNVNVLGNIVAPRYCALDWSVNGGWGGEYGGPDDPDSSPGGGGSLGQGGAGGTIQLKARSIDPYLCCSKLQANGGGGGSEAGDAYGGDEPGLSAPGGSGGQITVRTDGDLAPIVPNARWSLYANGGHGGMCGDCSGGQCYWWSANCACHEIQNWTGQGGNGGSITVEARDIDNLSFYSQGGNGGDGHSAHNMMCSYDGTHCLWGSNNGVRIGNGGDGASAGNGGIVSVISKTKSVGSGVSYVLNGGTRGRGGLGGRPGCTGGVQTCCTDNICPSGVDGADGANGSTGSFRTKRQGGSLVVLPLILEEK